MLHLFILLILLLQVPRTSSVWKQFDLVRTKLSSWGSSGHTAFRKINAQNGNGPSQIKAGSQFGFSVANVGDIDGDGVEDLLVGAPGEANTYYNATSKNSTSEVKSGAVYICFMTFDGTVKQSERIAGLQSGGPKLYAEDQFGYSVSGLGDLDGDGVPDVAVGAPGTYISSIYLLYMLRNGTVRDFKLIRGVYRGTVPPPVVNGSFPSSFYVPNGPELSFGSRFGTSLAPLGDWDADGVPDLCTSTSFISSGSNQVYMLFLHRNGTVKHHLVISNGVNGGPSYGQGVQTFSGFGSSMLVMPDSNGDGVPEMVFGAKDLQDEGTSHFKSGVLWYCYMHANATIQKCTRISELSGIGIKKGGGALPYTADDNCGVGVTQIGDINKDDSRSHWPLLHRPTNDPRKSLVDLVIGCPQTSTAASPGRLFFLFLTEAGQQQGYTLLPSATDKGVAPVFTPHEHVGASLAALQDYDKNGLKEVAAGAPGDIDGGFEAGAVFVFYFRRRRWHSFVPDTRSYLCKIIIPPSIFLCACFWGIVYFFYRFRREPDVIEIMVLKAGVEIESASPVSAEKKKKKKKERPWKENKGESKKDSIYADDF